jgi:hypothetical protein
MTATTRNYMIALLTLLGTAVLVLQSFGGEHVYRLTIGGCILMGCAYRIVDNRGMKIACAICIVVLIVRGVLQ